MALNFAWEISCFKLTAKFPTRNSGFSANIWHISVTHCGLWRLVIHSTRGLREISHSNIYHRDFDLARKFPPSCKSRVKVGIVDTKVMCQAHTGQTLPQSCGSDAPHLFLQLGGPRVARASGVLF